MNGETISIISAVILVLASILIFTVAILSIVYMVRTDRRESLAFKRAEFERNFEICYNKKIDEFNE